MLLEPIVLATCKTMIRGKRYVAIDHTHLQPAANHTIDCIVAASAHADHLDAGVASCKGINIKLKGRITSFKFAPDALSTM